MSAITSIPLIHTLLCYLFVTSGRRLVSSGIVDGSVEFAPDSLTGSMDHANTLFD